MTFRVLWTTYSVVAILDGATRKLLCLRSCRSKALDPQQMIQLVKTTTKKHGVPANLITDHGVQFRNRFKVGLKTLGIKHVRGQVRTPSFNGKVERFFKHCDSGNSQHYGQRHRAAFNIVLIDTKPGTTPHVHTKHSRA